MTINRIEIVAETTRSNDYLKVLSEMLQDSRILLPADLSKDYEILLDWLALRSSIPIHSWHNPVINILIHATYFLALKDIGSKFIQNILSQITNTVGQLYVQSVQGRLRESLGVKNSAINVIAWIPMDILLRNFLCFVDPTASIEAIISDYLAFVYAYKQNMGITVADMKILIQFIKKSKNTFIPLLTRENLAQMIPSTKRDKEFHHFEYLIDKYMVSWNLRTIKSFIRLYSYRLHIYFNYFNAFEVLNVFLDITQRLFKISYSFSFGAFATRVRIGLLLSPAVASILYNKLESMKAMGYIQSFQLLPFVEIDTNFSGNTDSELLSNVVIYKSDNSNEVQLTQVIQDNDDECSHELDVSDLIRILPAFVTVYGIDFVNPLNNFEIILNQVKEKALKWKDHVEPSISKALTQLLSEIKSSPNLIVDYYYKAWKDSKIRIGMEDILSKIFLISTRFICLLCHTSQEMVLPFFYQGKVIYKSVLKPETSIIENYVLLDTAHYLPFLAQLATNKSDCIDLINRFYEYDEMVDILHLWDNQKNSWNNELFVQEFENVLQSMKKLPRIERKSKELPLPSTFYDSTPITIHFNTLQIDDMARLSVSLSEPTDYRKSFLSAVFSLSNIEKRKEMSPDVVALLDEMAKIKSENLLVPTIHQKSVFVIIRNQSNRMISPHVLWNSPELNPLFCLGLQEVYFWPGTHDCILILEYQLPATALEPKGHFTRLMKYLSQFMWELQVFTLSHIYPLYHERAIFSADWHFAEFLNFSAKRTESDHSLPCFPLTESSNNIVARFSYPWTFWQIMTYVYEFCIQIPIPNPQIEACILVLVNEIELGFVYALVDSAGNKQLLILCRYNRNISKLVEIFKTKLSEFSIPLNITSIITFSELYPNHTLSAFIHRSRAYSHSLTAGQYQIPIFSTDRTILYTPTEQLLLYEFFSSLTFSYPQKKLTQINRIASDLKKRGQLSLDQLEKLFNDVNID